MGKWTRSEVLGLLSLGVAILIASTNPGIRNYVHSLKRLVLPNAVAAGSKNAPARPEQPSVRLSRPSQVESFLPPEPETSSTTEPTPEVTPP
jgi:hypothetical protein